MYKRRKKKIHQQPREFEYNKWCSSTPTQQVKHNSTLTQGSVLSDFKTFFSLVRADTTGTLFHTLTLTQHLVQVTISFKQYIDDSGAP